jgi:hypothetical protein
VEIEVSEDPDDPYVQHIRLESVDLDELGPSERMGPMLQE